MGDLIWAHQHRFSADIAYAEYLSMGFNVMFTSWHVIFVLGFDKGVSDEVANAHPELYLVGPKRALFNLKVFALWMLTAVWHGSLIWLLPYLWFGSTNNSVGSSFWLSSCTSFTA